MNVYEESVPESRVEMSLFEKTEDVYQTLHHPPVVKNLHPEPGSVTGGRFKTMQMVFNTLIIILLITVLLITVLILIGLRTESAAETLQNTALEEPQLSDEDRELWRLHEGDYYLFWEAEGTCTEAQNFCSERNCIIGSVTTKNQDLVSSEDLDESLRHCPRTGGDSEKAQGWVCTDKNFFLFHDFDFDIAEEDYMNVYEESVPESRMEMLLIEKTEDIYQTLHHQPPVVLSFVE
ncbi:uncharacterized protein LOC125781543 [Astyanax mexicanus]|uniref:uncharacterized protein LOC125781543 n=1 Tax=Astyanax mexicanus TaxID=7994 RepID=UPI0020CABEC7|nr:uncharacterized protein LOC125781543 [Astyanax mexicanus]